MRRFLALILSLMLLMTVCTANAETDEVLEAYRTYVDEELDTLRETATAWTAVLLDKAEITDVSYLGEGKYVSATITLPTLLCNTTAPTMAEAMSEYLETNETEELTLSATWSKKDSGYSFKWGVKNPKVFLSGVKNIAGAAKKKYGQKAFLALVNAALLPKTAEMPAKDNGTVPELGELPDGYAASMASALGITEAQAAQRLPAVMMLLSFSKIDVTNPLEETVLTMQAKDWSTMLDNALGAAEEMVSGMLGAPELSRDELEKIFCKAMNSVFTTTYYNTKKKPVNVSLTVDLAAAASGAGAASGLTDYLNDVMTEIDSNIDALAAYASELPYYPVTEMIDTGILSGSQDSDGNFVTFDLGDDTVNSAYVKIQRNGETVLTAFVRQGVQLNVRLNPGDYTVLYSKGASWYGEQFLFGAEAETGRFDLTVTDAEHTFVHMNTNAAGTLDLNSAAWDEVRNTEAD